MVTKRTKNLKKQEIPSLDDPISKLNHIGKETVKKLNELKASADEAQLQLPIPAELYRCVFPHPPWGSEDQGSHVFKTPKAPNAQLHALISSKLHSCARNLALKGVRCTPNSSWRGRWHAAFLRSPPGASSHLFRFPVTIAFPAAGSPRCGTSRRSRG